MERPLTPHRRSRVPLIVLLASSGLSFVGNVVASVAVPWFVLRTTGSIARTGLVAFFTFLPTVVASLFGGALADRLGFRKTSVIADAASGVTIAAIPLLHATVGLEFWALLTLVALGALMDAPGVVAREALVADLAEEAGMPVERATSAMQMVERLSRLVGAPLAGLTIAAAGATTAMWIDAATFAVSGFSIALAVKARRPTEAKPAGRYLAELAEGIRFIRRSRLQVWMIVTVMVTNFLDTPLVLVLLPAYANSVLNSPVALGLMIGASGGGAVIGAALFAAFGKRYSRRWIFSLGFLMVAMPYWVLTTLPSTTVAVVAMAIHGIGAGPLNPILGAVTLERTPPRLRGRVLGAGIAFSYMTIPVGAVLFGALAQVAGIRAMFIVIAASYTAWTIGIALNPVFRQMERDHPARVETEDYS